jgi:hypothetical protein
MNTRSARGRWAAIAATVSLVSWGVSGLAAGCVSSSTADGGDSGADQETFDSGAGDPGLPDTSTGGDAGDSGSTISDAALDTTGDAASDVTGDADGGACTQDLSNIGLGDFRIAFTIQTSATVGSAVVNQRGNCAAGIYWDVRMQANGALAIETDNNTLRPAGYTILGGTIPINDGATHGVVITRTGGLLAIRVDGVLDPTDAGATSTATFDTTLGAPLRIGTDVCDGIDGTVALSGTVTSVCVGP